MNLSSGFLCGGVSSSFVVDIATVVQLPVSDKYYSSCFKYYDDVVAIRGIVKIYNLLSNSRGES